MSVKLRFRRMGRRKQPVFALVAADSRAPRDGRYIEDLGRYEPVLEPAQVKFNEERIIYWLGQGAQPSNTVRNLLQKEGILLRSAMTRRGAEAEAIDQAVAEFKERQSAKVTTKKTVAERRAEALEAERKIAAEKAAELEKARKEREAELAKEREAAEAAARAEAEEARAQAAADAADSEALTTAADAPAAAPEADAAPADDTSSEAVPTVETEEATDEAVAETTAETVAEAAPDAAEEQPAVEETTTEEVAADTGAEVADQAEAAASEADVVEAEAAAPAEEEAVAETPVEATEDATADATEPEIAEEGETVAATDQPASDADIATGTAELSGDDLTTLKGVGPKYATILNDAGISTFAQLAEQTVDRLQEIITEAGSTTAGNEETWPEQARLLATGDQTGFDAYVESL